MAYVGWHSEGFLCLQAVPDSVPCRTLPDTILGADWCPGPKARVLELGYGTHVQCCSPFNEKIHSYILCNIAILDDIFDSCIPVINGYWSSLCSLHTHALHSTQLQQRLPPQTCAQHDCTACAQPMLICMTAEPRLIYMHLFSVACMLGSTKARQI